jgi:hypothetical protein
MGLTNKTHLTFHVFLFISFCQDHYTMASKCRPYYKIGWKILILISIVSIMLYGTIGIIGITCLIDTSSFMLCIHSTHSSIVATTVIAFTMCVIGPLFFCGLSFLLNRYCPNESDDEERLLSE